MYHRHHVYIAVFIIISILFLPTLVRANITVNNAPFGPDTLCIDKINVYSNDFHFLNGVFNDHSNITDYDAEGDCFTLIGLFRRPGQLYYTKPASKIWVTLAEDVLVSADLAPLKVNANLQTDVKKTIPVIVYMCPWYQGQSKAEAESCPLHFTYSKFTKDLSVYDGKHLKIIFDNTVVRDYSMKFVKGDIQSTEAINKNADNVFIRLVKSVLKFLRNSRSTE